MGKGDIRSRRGKIWRGTTGVTRPRKKSKTIRPSAPSRKVKTLKELPKAVAEPIVKKPVMETVPVVETVQPVVEGITAEVPQIVSEPVVEVPAVEPAHKEKKAEKKTAAKKTAKPAAKKTSAKKPAAKKPAAKKPAAKKSTAKKKK